MTALNTAEDLARNLIETLRAEFHLTLVVPERAPNMAQAASNPATLDRTLSRARIVAGLLQLEEPDAIYDIVGTTPEILKQVKAYQESGDPKLAEQFRAAQKQYNGTAAKVPSAIASLGIPLTPPDRPARVHYFGC